MMMKRGKKGGDDKTTKFDRLTKLWTEIDISEWTTLLREQQPQSRFTATGESIKGCCPFHPEDTASFWVTPSRGIAFCFGCKEMFTNPVAMIAKMCKMRMGEALLLIRRQFSIRGSLSDKFCDRVTEYETHQEFKRRIVDHCCSQLLAAIKLWPDDAALSEAGLYWAKPAVDYLLTRKLGEPFRGSSSGTAGADPWGVWETLCREQLVGVFPPLVSVQAEFGADSDEFKFYTEYTKKYTGEGNRYIGWLVLPYHDAPGSISRIKLREPVSVGKKNIITIEEDTFEDETDGFLGFYGLHYYRALLLPKEPGDPMVHTVCAVEGEFDALSSIAQQVRNGGSPDFISVALSGGGAPSVAGLYALGVSRVRLIGDNDAAGEKFVDTVIKKSAKASLSLQVFSWPDTAETSNVKDPDDAVKLMGYSWWQGRVSDDASFLSLPAWCVEQAKAEIARSSVSDIRMSGEIATRWGRCISDKQELEQYVPLAATACGVSAEVLREDLAPGNHEISDYLARTAVIIQQRFDVVGCQSGESRKRIMHLWDKQTRHSTEVVLNDEPGTETFFSGYYGPIDDMLEKLVGPLPETGEGEVTMIHSWKIKNCRHYLSQALLRMSYQAKDVQEYDIKKQGIHVVRSARQVSLTAPPRPDVYVVNGRDVFYVSYDEDDQMSAEFLTSPTHGKTLFQIDAAPWAQDLSLSRINTPVNLVSLFESLRKMIDIGWRWRYQEVDSIFLAAHVMCLSVMNLFKRQTLVFLTAERSSGKSRFLQGFVGKKGFPKINVLEHSMVLNDYTPSGLAGQAGGSTLCVCLDEFEQDEKNQQRNAAVKGIWLLLRDMISESEVTRVRGTNTGGFRTTTLRFPVMLAAINPPQDAADDTRTMTIEPVNMPGRGRPEDILLREIGETAIIKAREELTVGLIPHIQTLMRLQDEIERECSDRDNVPDFVPSRYLESLYPALTMLKFLKMEVERLGLPEDSIPNYKKFLRDFVTVRKSILVQQETNTTGEDILDALLKSFFSVNNNNGNSGSGGNIGNRHSIGGLLSDLNTVAQINKTVSGVYFDAYMEWLIVDWTQAKQCILRDHENYRNKPPLFLRGISSRSKYFVHANETLRTEALDRLAGVMGPAHNPDKVTIFSVRHILDKLRKYQTAIAHGISIVPEEVTNQADLEEAQAFAKQHGISVGKAAAILGAIKTAQEEVVKAPADTKEKKDMPATGPNDEDVV
jgi:hypothetical protein